MPDGEDVTASNGQGAIEDSDDTAADDSAEPGGRSNPARSPLVINIFPGEHQHLPAPISAAMHSLQDSLQMRVVSLVQGPPGKGPDLAHTLTPSLWNQFLQRREDLPAEKVALLLDSPGGDAKAAYQIARLLRRECGGFVAVVPRYAKSAATLLALGADKIIMGPYAELGPLDAQLFDAEREDFESALDEVHSLERLQAFSMEAVDSAMMLLVGRTGKRVDSLLPLILDYVAKQMAPLLDKIDTVHYTKRSRMLKVGEEYAVRLLRRSCAGRAEQIARHLVEKYPEHGFMIDDEEARTIGLEVETADGEVLAAMDALLPMLGRAPMLGLVGPPSSAEENDDDEEAPHN